MNIKLFSKFPMKDWSQMDSFMALTHGQMHPLRQRDLFEWFFLRNPNSDDANLIVAYDGAKLVSLLGYIPTNFYWNGKVVLGAWMAHWMTLEQYRNGIGTLLMRRITEMYPIVAGQGASMMNQLIVTKMGFSFTEEIPKVVYLIQPNILFEELGYVSTNKISNSRDNLVGTAIPFNSITPEIYQPDWAQYPDLKFGTLRDLDYLHSRYLAYPFHKYHVFIEGNKTTPIVVIIRIIETNKKLKVARILEFFTPQGENYQYVASKLLLKVINFAELNGCSYVDFYTNSEFQLGLLRNIGFYDESGLLPSLLDPIDLTRKFQNFELFVSEDLQRESPDCVDNFYISRADGDQDRPNEKFVKMRANQ
jgi:hypothetical protein